MEFHGSKQEQKERQEKVEESQAGDNPFPTASHAMEVPVDFLWNIAGIDDEQLTKRDVGPEKHKGEEQVSEVMIMSFVYSFRHGMVVFEKGQHDDRESVGDKNLADEHDDGEHGGVPFFFEGYDPIDVDESSQEGIDDDAGAA